MTDTSTASYEKLGAFYLGRRYDLEQRRILAEDVLYDSKDLTTHAVCVGMTGSGKTGLCVSLLEEAALDGIPAIVIDPKGDLGNLLLTFPELQPADFRPWIDEDAARRKGLEPSAYARQTAELWKKGLADWGQDGDRIARLRKAADVALYTPGSSAGLPLTVLRSFDAPPPALRDDAELLADRVQAAASGLLTLVGRDSDPVNSREHILLANILSTAWTQGRSLDLPGIIREVQTPPFDKLGVFDLETFVPAEQRFQLAMALNNVLASPSFASWLQGEPLDIGRLLYAEDGRPRLSILSIAHLSDSERMFFVTLLLNEVLAWVRTQPGTSSLRALLYMDEIFGYFPPSAEPPSKKPMLTLLKQARAYGLGVVLSTQNPVDLDYKGLSNTGTWLLGRLQTERDKARVLEGLEGAAAATGSGLDRKRMDTILSGLGSRVFLMHNVHEDEPVVLHSRWAMSYLRGPMTRPQIESLTADRKAAATDRGATAAPVSTAAADTGRPVLPPAVEESFIPASQAAGDRSQLLYRPAVGASARLHFVNATHKVDHWLDLAALAPIPADGDVAWSEANLVSGKTLEAVSEPSAQGAFETLPAGAGRKSSYSSWQKSLVNHLYQNERLELFGCKALKQVSRPGESEGEFRGRLAHLAREARDLATEKLRKRYAAKLATIQDRIRRAEQKVEVQQSQHSQQKLSAMLSVGATLAGAIFGRKLGSATNVSRTSTAIRGFGRSAQEKDDVRRAAAELTTQQGKLADLEAELQREVSELESSWNAAAIELETIEIKPRKSDIQTAGFGLVWTPWRRDESGLAEPLYRLD